MSAYVVNEATMDDAVAAIMTIGRRTSDLWIAAISMTTSADVAECGKLGAIDVIQHRASKIGRRLFKLNDLAVTTKYEDAKPNPIVELYEAPLPLVLAINRCWNTQRIYGEGGPELVQVYKSVQCLGYQCDEEKARDHEDRKGLQWVENYLARRIVDALPVYDQAQWGRQERPGGTRVA